MRPNDTSAPCFAAGDTSVGFSPEGREREILGGLEAAADEGADGKANRFIITIPHGDSLTNDSPVLRKK